MRKQKFAYESAKAGLVDLTAEAEVFSQNGVKIVVRTTLRTMESTLMVSYNDPATGERAYRPFYHLEQAVDFAEDVQGSPAKC